MSPMPSPLQHARRPDIRHTQNFLRDPRLVTSLLETCALAPDSLVVEIGPGKGAITNQLARLGGRVVAIEKDTRLAASLRQRFRAAPGVTIVEEDFLRYRLPREPYHVVANIPFNITSAIVERLTAAPLPPETAHLVMQREAAETLVGRPRESLRALLLKPWFEVDIVRRLRRTDFTPSPRVDVVMLRLRKRGPPLIHNTERQTYRDFVTYLFTAWRPTVTQGLARICTRRQLATIRAALDFTTDTTPTSLTFAQWLALFAAYQPIGRLRGDMPLDGSERRHERQTRMLQKIHRTRVNK